MKDLSIPVIVALWLEANSYDGLVNQEAGCACALGDFMPCGDGYGNDCVAGHEVEAPGDSGVDFWIIPGRMFQG